MGGNPPPLPKNVQPIGDKFGFDKIVAGSASILSIFCADFSTFT
jgi:hypothetical protein